MLFFERLTNFYFLGGNPLYGLFSGLRIELFVVAAIGAGAVAGKTRADILEASGAIVVGVLGFLFTVYAVCDPRVCYSLGIDGLEPVRMGVFLSSVAIGVASIGRVAQKEMRGAGRFGLCLVSFVSIGYLPTAFTLGGTRLLQPFHAIALPGCSSCFLTGRLPP